MKFKIISSVLAIMFFLLFLSSCASNSKWYYMETRKDVKQPFHLIKPKDQEPIGTVLLIKGGNGYVVQPTVTDKNFLVRSANIFAEKGFLVAVIYIPSNRKVKGRYWEFRMSSEHVYDVNKVITFLKKEVPKKPIWIVGTSMGTISAANLAINLKNEIDGLVLTSSITKSDPHWAGKVICRYPRGILSMNLEKITVPTLVVSHRDDSCVWTPAENAKNLKEALVNAPKTEIMCFEGGKNSKREPCYGRAHHGFYGIEEKVVSAISEFIKHGTNNIRLSCHSEKINSGVNFTTEIVSIEKNHKEYRMILIEPVSKPFGTVVMFRSMGGTVPVGGTNQKPTITKYCNSFVAKTMYDFARKGFRVLVAGRPRYIKQDTKWLSYYRLENEHIDEIKTIISVVRNRSNEPIWLLGSSRGTLSAVQGAMHLKEVDGLALVSPRVGTYENEIIKFEKPNVLLDVELEKIKVPVIMVSHRKDPSGISSCEGSNKIKKRLINSPSVKVECFEGGKPYPQTFVKDWKRRGRQTNRPHRFWGIENKVVDVVTNFMKSSL